MTYVTLYDPMTGELQTSFKVSSIPDDPPQLGVHYSDIKPDLNGQRIDVEAVPPTLVSRVVDEENELSKHKSWCKSLIDQKAGSVKALVGSPGYAIDATYKAKEDEARRYVADPDPDSHLADYPYIAAGVGIDGATAADVAGLYIAMATAWHAFNAAVEAVRIGTKQAVDAAVSIEAVDTIMAGITWPDAPA